MGSREHAHRAALACRSPLAGGLVTREEIKTSLWADNVDVDVEQGLNYCIKEIRSALGDNAEAPRFIQTLPRRGYRFMGDVRRVEFNDA